MSKPNSRFLLGVTYVIICLLLWSPVYATPNIEQSQIEKLLTAVWEEPINTIEMVVYVEKNKQPMPEVQIRSIVEKMYTASDIGAINTTEDSRQAEINAEVDRIKREQENPTLLKQRITLKDHFMRVDENNLSALYPTGFKVPVLEYTRTYVNAGDPASNDYTHYEYNHVSEIATIFNSKDRWHKARVNEWFGIPSHMKIVLQSMLGNLIKDDGMMRFQIDPQKVEKFRNNEIENIAVTIEKQNSGKDTVVLSHITESKSTPILVMQCDQSDYSKVYLLEAYDLTTGHCIQRRECNGFDSKGFPEEMRISNYSRDTGDLLKEAKYAIESVELNKEIPVEFFDFSLPSGYSLVDRRLDSPLVVQIDSSTEIPENLYNSDIVSQHESNGHDTKESMDNVTERKKPNKSVILVKDEPLNDSIKSNYSKTTSTKKQESYLPIILLFVVVVISAIIIFTFIYKRRN